MNTNKGQGRIILIGCLVGVLVFSLFAMAVVWAAARQRPDYQGFNLERPWFDGKEWDWFRDMFNGPQIKPQEVGTFQRFPLDSVPRSGSEPFIPATALLNGRLLRDLQPENPTQADQASLATGKVMYETYCGVCHGNDGKANTPVSARGMPAPGLTGLRGLLSEAHLYNKIRYGGAIMPAYGFQTTRIERWAIVNYLKSADFGKGAGQ